MKFKKRQVGGCPLCDKPFPATLKAFERWKWIKVKKNELDVLVCVECAKKRPKLDSGD